MYPQEFALDDLYLPVIFSMKTKYTIILNLQWKVKNCPRISEEHKCLSKSGKIFSLTYSHFIPLFIGI